MNHLNDFFKKMNYSSKTKPPKVMNTIRSDVTSSLFPSVIYFLVLFICLGVSLQSFTEPQRTFDVEQSGCMMTN